MSYLRSSKYKWFDNGGQESGRVYRNNKGITGYGIGCTPCVEWVSLASSVIREYSDVEVKVDGEVWELYELAKQFMAQETHINADEVDTTVDFESDEYSLEGPYSLNTQFAEVSLRMLERTTNGEHPEQSTVLEGAVDAFSQIDGIEPLN